MEFQVLHREPELIVPSQTTPNEIKSLSDIDDQQTFRDHYSVIMFYKNNPVMEGKDPVITIRQAIAKTLVYYYPYAGRLIEGPGNKLMVDCTAEGVVFVEADALVTIEQLGDTIWPPPYSELLLCDVPGWEGIIGSPLMLIQVTRFACGGFVLAIRFNHVMSDAIGSLQFVTAVTEMAKGASTPSTLPVWKRELLTASCSPRITHAHPEFQEMMKKDDMTPWTMDSENLVQKAFNFGPEEIKTIRKKLPPEIHSSSRFDLITACLWRSWTRALQFDPDDNVRITCAVNVRGKNGLGLPLGYYGNAIIFPAKASKVKTLCNSSLEYAIKLVKEVLEQATEDYLRSTIDYIATNGRPKVTSPGNFTVSDTSKAGYDKVDFGWGKPIYAGIMYGGSGTFNNLVYIIYTGYKNQKGEDVLVVPICLPVAVMERFENELRRLIWETVEDTNDSNPIMVPSKL